MKQIAYLSASTMVLGLFLAGPASAQQATTPPASIAAPSAAASTDQIKDRLGDIKVEDRKEFRGHLARAQSPEGQPVIFIIGPENFEGDTSPEGFSQDKVRGQLTQGAFTNIEFIDNIAAVRGELDDKAVLALSAQQGWLGAGGTAQSSKPDMDRLKEQLGKVGLSETSEFNGKLVQARGPNGQPVLVLLASEDFTGDSSIELSAADLSDMQKHGFANARLAEDVAMVRGKIDDLHVLALSGSGLESDMATGTVPGAGDASNIGSPPMSSPAATPNVNGAR